MSIVFDQIDGVVEPNPEAPDDESSNEAKIQNAALDIDHIHTQLERMQRRQRRLVAD